MNFVIVWLRESGGHTSKVNNTQYTGGEKGLNMSLAFFRVGILKAVTVAVMNDDRLGNTLARCLCFRLYFSFMKQTRVTLCNKHLRGIQIASSQKQLVSGSFLGFYEVICFETRVCTKEDLQKSIAQVMRSLLASAGSKTSSILRHCIKRTLLPCYHRDRPISDGACHASSHAQAKK